MSSFAPHYQPLTMDTLHTKEVLVLGLGREGLSSYRFLRSHFPTKQVWLMDDHAQQELSDEWQQIFATDSLALFVSPTNLASISPTLVFKTPGLPPHHNVVSTLQRQQVAITSNTQLFFDLLPAEKDITTIGVTGTKGKSTTTAFVHHVLTTGDKTSFLGGNIGVPPLDLLGLVLSAANQNETVYVVLELSCHQLADLKASPEIAVITNISPEHLDYYDSFAEYVQAKSQIARWQSNGDVVIYRASFGSTAEVARLSPGTHLHIPEEPEHEGWLTYRGQALINAEQIAIPGRHNQLNLLPGVMIGFRLHISLEKIQAALQTFRGLPHRLELVATHNEVRYYDDSLSTEPGAAIAAIEAMCGEPIILLAGGYERKQDFTQLAKTILENNVKAAILFPTTGERLWQKIEETHQATPGTTLPEHQAVTSMSEAISTAKKWAQPGDVVLMSPASASFNSFKDYEDRAQQFKEAIGQ